MPFAQQVFFQLFYGHLAPSRYWKELACVCQSQQIRQTHGSEWVPSTWDSPRGDWLCTDPSAWFQVHLAAISTQPPLHTGTPQDKVVIYLWFVGEIASCTTINSTYSYTFLYSMVCLSVCLSSVCHIHAPCLNSEIKVTSQPQQTRVYGGFTFCWYIEIELF